MQRGCRTPSVGCGACCCRRPARAAAPGARRRAARAPPSCAGRPRCRSRPPSTRCAALLAYEGVGRELVARLKYRNARAAAGFLAGAMAALVDPADVDVVTWAPTTRGPAPPAGVRPGRGCWPGWSPAASAVPCRPLLTRPPGPPQTGRAGARAAIGPGASRPRADRRRAGPRPRPPRRRRRHHRRHDDRRRPGAARRRAPPTCTGWRRRAPRSSYERYSPKELVMPPMSATLEIPPAAVERLEAEPWVRPEAVARARARLAQRR